MKTHRKMTQKEIEASVEKLIAAHRRSYERWYLEWVASMGERDEI